MFRKRPDEHLPVIHCIKLTVPRLIGNCQFYALINSVFLFLEIKEWFQPACDNKIKNLVKPAEIVVSAFIIDINKKLIRKYIPEPDILKLKIFLYKNDMLLDLTL